jgi:YbbR domain-containing protein
MSASVPPEMGDVRPNVIYTERIDLSGRTEDFTTFARLATIDGVTILSAQTIEVSISIEANIVQRTYDSVPVEFLSQNPEYEGATEAIPSQVTVVLTGPQPLLDALTLADISAVVDMTGLGPGRYDRPVTVTVNVPEIDPDDIRVLPATVGIIIGERQPTGTAPPTADAESGADATPSAAITPTP